MQQGTKACLRLPNLSALQLVMPFAFPVCCNPRPMLERATCSRMVPEPEWITALW